MCEPEHDYDQLRFAKQHLCETDDYADAPDPVILTHMLMAADAQAYRDIYRQLVFADRVSQFCDAVRRHWWKFPALWLVVTLKSRRKR